MVVYAILGGLDTSGLGGLMCICGLDTSGLGGANVYMWP